MNGRKAKELRRISRGLTVGKPNTKHGRKTIGGSPTATIMLDDCTRRQYKQLKRMTKGLSVVQPKKRSKGIQKNVQS